MELKARWAATCRLLCFVLLLGPLFNKHNAKHIAKRQRTRLFGLRILGKGKGNRLLVRRKEENCSASLGGLCLKEWAGQLGNLATGTASLSQRDYQGARREERSCDERAFVVLVRSESAAACDLLVYHQGA